MQKESLRFSIGRFRKRNWQNKIPPRGALATDGGINMCD